MWIVGKNGKRRKVPVKHLKKWKRARYYDKKRRAWRKSVLLVVSKYQGGPSNPKALFHVMVEGKEPTTEKARQKLIAKAKRKLAKEGFPAELTSDIEDWDVVTAADLDLEKPFLRVKKKGEKKWYRYDT
jgi:hypothetical protein